MSQPLGLSLSAPPVIVMVALALLLLLSACSEPSQAPEPEQNLETSLPDWPHGAMVSAANPLAVDAGIKMLKLGGNAIDAAIATHLVPRRISL